MNRIHTILNKNGKGKFLIPFLTAGFPNGKMFLELIDATVDSGADFIEIGMPFSDPLADGPEVQYSSFLALQNGVTLKKILKTVELIRRKQSLPLLLMGYYNPLLTYGEVQFMKDAKSAGIDGLIIPDLPIDEADDFKRAANKYELSTVFLVAPTSSKDRVKRIDKLCTDFVYAVTVTGVTGAGKKFNKSTDDYLKSLKGTLTKPFVAGFGVSSPETAKRLSKNSNGVVIGSKLISIIRQSKNNRQAVQTVELLLTQIRKALK
jgi:tryptophan synthase alpha chain